MTESEVRSLQSGIEAITASEAEDTDSPDARRTVDRLLDALESGVVRAAARDDSGQWVANPWVKAGILLAFRVGGMSLFENGSFSFVDRETLAPRRFTEEDRVRIVPGGSAVRRGAHLGAGTVCMPPSYVNVGSFVDEDTMVDSHVLVGSCAQIGARVHLSAAVQIGGVLEPVGALPVIIEDDVFIGGGCGVYEGCIVGRGAVLAPGVILSRATPVFDLVQERVVRANNGLPLMIPSGAVLVPGTRPAASAFARREGISIYSAVIVKYRDARTDVATALESALRAHGMQGRG